MLKIGQSSAEGKNLFKKDLTAIEMGSLGNTDQSILCLSFCNAKISEVFWAFLSTFITDFHALKDNN